MNSFAIVALALVAAAAATNVPASTTLVRDAAVVSPYVPSYVSPVVPSTYVAGGVVPTTNYKAADVKTAAFPYAYQSVYPAGVYPAGVYPAGVYHGGVYGAGYPAVYPHVY